jgi:hypothetical protein
MRQWSRQNRRNRQVYTLIWISFLFGLALGIGGLPAVLAVGAGVISGAVWGHLFWDTAGEHVKHAEDFKTAPLCSAVENGVHCMRSAGHAGLHMWSNLDEPC